jgi:hypothetical protein
MDGKVSLALTFTPCKQNLQSHTQHLDTHKHDNHIHVGNKLFHPKFNGSKGVGVDYILTSISYDRSTISSFVLILIVRG